jgi:uncharacterized membrane protein YfcA
MLLLFGAGLTAGFINVMAGGGSTITMPIMIFLGLDAATANGTNRIAIMLQNASAVTSFKKENVSDFKESMKMSLFTLPGAIAGAIAAVEMSDAMFQRILGIVMIGIIITMIIPKKKNDGSEKPKYKWLIYPAMFGLGFYGGFIQVGIGFLLMASLHGILKLKLVEVNMHKVFIVLIYTAPVFLIFLLNGKVHWLYGLALSSGNALGAWWSAKLSVKKGDKIVKVVLSIAILIMALKLLEVF